MQPASCYGRPPAPLPPQSPPPPPQSPTPLGIGGGGIINQQQHPVPMPAWTIKSGVGNDHHGEDHLLDEDENEDETHYASQLRSSMAALLQATSGAQQQQQHVRQASNSSSTYSSYSDEFSGSRADPAAAAAATAQQVAQQLGIPNPHHSSYGGHHSPSSPPPPPPPVRDASSLKYVKYGPGHEKHPSWPMPATTGSSNSPASQTNSGATGTATGQSQRSKSWTEHTDYPKEPQAGYVRPNSSAIHPPRGGSGGGTNPSSAYSQQLKTVLESCESRIPPEVYNNNHHHHHHQVVGIVSGHRYLPTYDCDGRNIDDKDYAIPSPPERDIAVVGSTEGFNFVGGRGIAASSSLTSSSEMLGSDYVKYDDVQQYSNSSEGYSSYVPSESSYVSCLSGGTPLLDQLRRDGHQGSNGTDHQPGGSEGGASALLKEGARDSVSTVVTHSSGSNSSNETLRWHGSYSDLSSVASGGSRGMPRPEAATADPSALVVHSAKVQPPQRHNSESVLYYEQQHLASGQKTINRQGGWSQRVERKNQWNAQQPSLPEEPAAGEERTAPLSVAERIHQLEWHAGSAAASSRSVPNLAPLPPQRSVSIDSALPTSSSSSIGAAPLSADASAQQQQPKYTFLDPDKRMKVADPTLKAIQKQALLSYYERHAGRTSTAASGPNKSPPKSDVQQQQQQGVPSSPPPVGDASGCDVQQIAEAQQAKATTTIMRTSPDSTCGHPLIPPERPPKKPHLRSSAGPILQATPAVVVAVEDSHHHHQKDQVMVPVSKPIPPAKRKPPAPDPALSPLGGTIRSDSPDLPLPPPPPLVLPAGAEDGGEEGTSVDDEDQLPLPPPPPPIVLDDDSGGSGGGGDGRAQSQTSPTPMYHKESYMAHRKAALHSPVNNSNSYNPPRRSMENLLNSSSPSPPPSSSVTTTEIAKASPFRTSSSSSSSSSMQQQQQTARSTYLRQVSEGRPYSRTDPGPPRSLLELNRSVSVQHQRSHSDGNSNGDEQPMSAAPMVSSAPFKPLPPLPPPAARPKRPEELECDELSADLMNHLPTDSKLHALLSVPDPASAADSLRTEGLLQVQLSGEEAAVPQTATSSSNTSTTSSLGSSTSPLPQQPSPPPSVNASPIKSSSCAPLPATSAYFTTSEPKAKLLNRYHSSQNILMDESGKAGVGGNSPAGNKIEQQPVDSELLMKKKEELMARLARKLDVLRSEREAIQEEVEANELLGRTVTSRVATVATPAETNKVFLHVAEVDKITVLLLALAGRLARAQNALQSLPADAEPQEKVVLEGKRDKLMEQLEEAKRLKENIDRRSRRVSLLLSKYLSEEEFADYSHFVTMKTKLVIDQREIDEKIKLGDEQLIALRENLLFRPRV